MFDILEKLLQTYNNDLREKYEMILKVISNISYGTLEHTLFLSKYFDNVFSVSHTPKSETEIIKHVSNQEVLYEILNEGNYEDFLKMIITTIICKQFKTKAPLLIKKDENTVTIPSNTAIPVKVPKTDTNSEEYNIYCVYTKEDIDIDVTTYDNQYIQLEMWSVYGRIELNIQTIEEGSQVTDNDVFYIGYVGRENNDIKFIWDVNKQMNYDYINYDTESTVNMLTNIVATSLHNFKDFYVSDEMLDYDNVTDLTLTEEEYNNILVTNNVSFVDKNVEYLLYRIVDINNEILYSNKSRYSFYELEIEKDVLIEQFDDIFNAYKEGNDLYYSVFEDENINLENIRQSLKYDYDVDISGLAYVHSLLTKDNIIKKTKYSNENMDVVLKITDTTDRNQLNILMKSTTLNDYMKVSNGSNLYTIGYNKNILTIDDIYYVNEGKLNSVIFYENLYNNDVNFFCYEYEGGGIFSNNETISDVNITYVYCKKTSLFYKLEYNRLIVVTEDELDDILVNIILTYDAVGNIIPTKKKHYKSLGYDDVNFQHTLDINMKNFIVDVLSTNDGKFHIQVNNEGLPFYSNGDYVYYITIDMDSNSSLASYKEGKPVYKLLKLNILSDSVDSTKNYPLITETDSVLEVATQVTSSAIMVTGDYESGDRIKLIGDNLPTEVDSDTDYYVSTSTPQITITDSDGTLIALTDGTYEISVVKSAGFYSQDQNYNVSDLEISNISIIEYSTTTIDSQIQVVDGSIYKIGQRVRFIGTLPLGLLEDTDYYIILIDDTTNRISLSQDMYSSVGFVDGSSLDINIVDVVDYNNIIHDNISEVSRYLQMKEINNYIKPLNHFNNTSTDLFNNNFNNVLDYYIVSVDGNNLNSLESLYSDIKPLNELISNYFQPRVGQVINKMNILKVSSEYITNDFLANNTYFKWNGNYYIIKNIRQYMLIDEVGYNTTTGIITGSVINGNAIPAFKVTDSTLFTTGDEIIYEGDNLYNGKYYVIGTNDTDNTIAVSDTYNGDYIVMDLGTDLTIGINKTTNFLGTFFEANKNYQFNEHVYKCVSPITTPDTYLVPNNDKITFPFNDTTKEMVHNINNAKFNYNNYNTLVTTNKNNIDVTDYSGIKIQNNNLIFETSGDYTYKDVVNVDEYLHVNYENEQTSEGNNIGNFVENDYVLRYYNEIPKTFVEVMNGVDFNTYGTLLNVGNVTATSFTSDSEILLGVININDITFNLTNVSETLGVYTYTYSSPFEMYIGDLDYTRIEFDINDDDLITDGNSLGTFIEKVKFYIKTGKSFSKSEYDLIIFYFKEYIKYKYYKNTGGKHVLTISDDSVVDETTLKQLRKVELINE